MKTLAHPVVIVALISISLAGASWAQAAWPWSKPESKTLPVSKTTHTPLIGGKPVFTSASSQPSTWQKITSGTKKVATGTVDVLTLKPLRDKWSADKTPKKTSAGYNVQPKKSSNSSWLGSMFKPKEEKKIKTVGDWMAQPAPRP